MSSNSTSLGPTSSGDNGPVTLSITLWLLVTSFIFVLLRCISRIGIVRRFGWDDYLIVLAWLLAFGMSFSIFWGVRYGLGQSPSSDDDMVHVLRKTEYAFSVLYNPVLMATKSSILAFYFTLAKNRRPFQLAIWTTLVVVNVAGLAFTLILLFQCNPISSIFANPIPADTSCIDLTSLYLSSSPVNIITDVAILFLPMPVLGSLRLPKKQKIAVFITMSFGVFVVAVDIVRVSYLENAFVARLQASGGRSASANTTGVFNDNDFALVALWSAVECEVGIICACVPALKPLVAKFTPSLITDKIHKHTQRHSGTRDSNRHDPFKNYEMGGANGAAHPPRPAEQAVGDDAGSQHSPTSGEPKSSDPSSDPNEIGLVDFLTTPDGPNANVPPPSPSTIETNPRRLEAARKGSVLLDFYNMKGKKPMTELTHRESLGPLALVTFLFFLWGGAYALLDQLNNAFATVVQLDNTQVAALHAAYYGGYFLAPMTIGHYVFRTYGFKATFITGLALYGLGTLIFWPSAVLFSYPAFIVSNLVVGGGVAILELGSNPFIALCGPPRFAEIRLNVSQGVQATATVLFSLLARKALFRGVQDGSSLINVQWSYLGIAIFDALLCLVFVYTPIPEASDADFEEASARRGHPGSERLFGIRTIYVTLGLACFAQFMYVGAQESVSLAFTDYVAAVQPSSLDPSTPADPFAYFLIGQSVFALGRFLCAALQYLLAPRSVLLALFLGMVLFAALCTALSAAAAVAALILYELFQSGVFPLVYAIALRGLGRRTKLGAVALTAATSGGAVFPVITNGVAGWAGIKYAFVTVVAPAAAGVLFPLYLCVWRPARRQVDPETRAETEREARLIRRRGTVVRPSEPTIAEEGTAEEEKR